MVLRKILRLLLSGQEDCHAIPALKKNPFFLSPQLNLTFILYYKTLVKISVSWVNSVNVMTRTWLDSVFSRKSQ